MDIFRSLWDTTVAHGMNVPKHRHPYVPKDIRFENYVPNDKDALYLLVAFASGMAGLLAATFVATRALAPKLKKSDQATILWFVMSGSLHVFFEGYLVFNYFFSNILPKQDLFAQLWKEYTLSDSRYLTGETLVITMESMTVLIWGPLSFLTAALILTSHPLRHPLQSIVSVGHVYSDSLYFATAAFDYYVRGINHCREEPYYFWVYFLFMNSFWIVVPAILLHQSITATGKAFSTLDGLTKTVGSYKKNLQGNQNGSVRASPKG